VLSSQHTLALHHFLGRAKPQHARVGWIFRVHGLFPKLSEITAKLNAILAEEGKFSLSHSILHQPSPLAEPTLCHHIHQRSHELLSKGFNYIKDFQQLSTTFNNFQLTEFVLEGLYGLAVFGNFLVRLRNPITPLSLTGSRTVAMGHRCPLHLFDACFLNSLPLFVF